MDVVDEVHHSDEFDTKVSGVWGDSQKDVHGF